MAVRQYLIACNLYLRYGVVAAASPGVATADAAKGEPEALDNPLFLQCLNGIGGTGGSVAAHGGKEGGDEPLIETDGEDEQAYHDLRTEWGWTMTLQRARLYGGAGSACGR